MFAAIQNVNNLKSSEDSSVCGDVCAALSCCPPYPSFDNANFNRHFFAVNNQNKNIIENLPFSW
jgi:hypothetical protein